MVQPFDQSVAPPLLTPNERFQQQPSAPHRLPSSYREPLSSSSSSTQQQGPSLQQPGRVVQPDCRFSDHYNHHHPQPAAQLNPICSPPPPRSSSKAHHHHHHLLLHQQQQQLLANSPSSEDPIIQVDDPLLKPPQHLQLPNPNMASMAPPDSYRKEHITLDQPQYLNPVISYRSAASSPTVIGQSSAEKISLSPQQQHQPINPSLSPNLSPPGPKLKLHQRVVRAIKQEASECKQAALEIVHFVKHHDWKKTIRTAFQRKYWGWWLLLLVVLILSSLLSSYHTKVALYLKPYQAQIKDASWSWIVPTVLLIIVSFPPLFGHELIILVAGMIWGLWIGFAIACAGTFLGEIMTYYAFKHLISERSARVEAGSVTYASLAKLMREGGLTMVILVRASAMPGHVCTAMQATIGIGVWVFTIACLVTLPKQFALVYVGVLLGDPGLDPKDPLGVQSSPSSSKHDAENQEHHRVSAAVFLLTGFFTLISAYIVWMRLRKIRPQVQQEFEARKFAQNGLPPLPSLDHLDRLDQHHPHQEALNLSEKPAQLDKHPFYQSSAPDTQTPAPVYSLASAV
ncbi:hypothetical protein PGT21_015747 [Puccinia graminis f. sp. tritici]|uniref:Golgi apparatus membrane protein TVP38 n=1 Tax=Puccinia graminis f. sp. tritici TaxID=56615 RepID=A0A5B0LW74_PUCGR|nr:hypothetical protein PGTUg99_036186 [Puccinia graminis f. sp. tritici]KAA1104236.1 hypothetical protein PGT21_015747 [Puccinia graminis f. sp. tritici]